MKIYCMTCKFDVEARLTDGAERYPHRPDLSSIPFWHCDTCGNWVGCHHKTKTPTKPLGILASPEMFKARVAIHELIDPIWKSNQYDRNDIYRYMSKKLGFKYHAAELRTMEDAREAWKIAADLNNQYKWDSEVILR